MNLDTGHSVLPWGTVNWGEQDPVELLALPPTLLQEESKLEERKGTSHHTAGTAVRAPEASLSYVLYGTSHSGALGAQSSRLGIADSMRGYHMQRPPQALC